MTLNHGLDRNRSSPTPQQPMAGEENDLNTSLSSESTATPIQPQAPPRLSHWLSVDQIRKMQRMRRERVIEAMENGELPFERRGRIRYARLTDVIAWEVRRIERDYIPKRSRVRSDLADFA